jgi:hypothetical protein
MSIFWLSIHYAIHSLGAALIYAALFLHENEERKIEDRVVQWWIRLDEKQIKSRSRAATFMREVARLTTRGFNRLLGERTVSLRFVLVSIYLSIASMFFFISVAFGRAHNPGNTSRHQAFFYFLIFLLAALTPALDDSWLARVLSWSPILLFLISTSGFLAFVIARYGVLLSLRWMGIALTPFLVSLLWDFAYVSLTRWILRRISAIDHVYEIVLMIFVNLILAVLPIVGTVYLGAFIFRFAPDVGALTVLSFVFNFINVIAGLAALLLALFLLVHRLFWPIIQRPLYAIQRYTPIKKKGWLFTTGVALIFLPGFTTIGAIIKYLFLRLS